jgi:hypothetical protein
MAAHAAPAGYSGKAVWQKLGLKAGQRLFVLDAPMRIETLLGGMPDGVTRLSRLAACDVALAFATERARFEHQIAALVPNLAEGGMLWLAWPKKSSGVPTDVTEHTLRAIVLPTGWVDVKVCAIDATWSALKFLRRRK